MPAGAFLAAFFLAPLGYLVRLSVDTHTPGYVGTGEAFEFTLGNYGELWTASFFGFVRGTLELAGLSAILSVALGVPLAYLIARGSPTLRRGLLIALVSTLLLNVVVRLYAINLSVLSLDWVSSFFEAIGLPSHSSGFARVMIVAGLLHIMIPITALTLVGPIQNVDPGIEEAAQVLGATRLRSILTAIRVAGRGVLGSFLLAFAVGVSAFVVPLLLGRGFILFVSNLVYNRFSVVANYPSGAAIALVLLLVSVLLLGVIGRLVGGSRWANSR